jgi:hypothetical protein
MSSDAAHDVIRRFKPGHTPGRRNMGDQLVPDYPFMGTRTRAPVEIAKAHMSATMNASQSILGFEKSVVHNPDQFYENRTKFLRSNVYLPQANKPGYDGAQHALPIVKRAPPPRRSTQNQESGATTGSCGCGQSLSGSSSGVDFNRSLGPNQSFTSTLGQTVEANFDAVPKYSGFEEERNRTQHNYTLDRNRNFGEDWKRYPAVQRMQNPTEAMLEGKQQAENYIQRQKEYKPIYHTPLQKKQFLKRSTLPF